METLIVLAIFSVIFVIYKIKQARNNKERMLKRIREMEDAGYKDEAAILRKALHLEMINYD